MSGMSFAWLHRLLRWSEKYTKTDMVYLAEGGFWLTLGQVVSSLSALALAVAFANLVPSETYGTYKYLLSIAGVFAIFTLPGMNAALARAVAQGHEGLIHSVTNSRAMHSLIGSIIALAGSSYYFLNENVGLSLSLLIIAATLPVFDTLTGYLSYLLGKRRFDLQTIYHLVAQTVSTTILIGTIALTNSIILILLAYFVPLILIRGFLYLRIARTISKNEVRADIVKETHTYGKHLTAMQILGVISGNIDKILLWKFFGPTQLAIYAFSVAIPEQIKGPIKGVSELAFPKFAAQTPGQIRANLPSLFRKIGLYALALLSISVVYILVAPYIFALLFPQYIESVLYSQVFALSLVTGASSIALSILSAQKKTTVQYVVTTVQPLITVVLLLSLVPLYGVMGAILALVISRFIAATIFLGSLFTLK